MISDMLAPLITSFGDILTFQHSTDPVGLLRSNSGEFSKDMARIFPMDWAWAALAAKTPTRQIWFGVLSGFPELPEDCSSLRANLLTMDQNLLLRLRFGPVGGDVGSILMRLERSPLPRKLYDPLARMLKADPTNTDWYAAKSGALEEADLVDHIQHFIQENENDDETR